MSDVFISYAREDRETVKRFATAFEGAGVSVWWDTALRSGESFDFMIEEAIKGAKAVIVLWSAHSVQSRWVRAEATLADRLKTLVPARIGPCDLPIMFELTQTADLSRWQGDASDKIWLAFLADVRRVVEKPAEPVAPDAAAPARPDLASLRVGERGGAPSLAVLPFANRSGLPEDEVFAIGMVEDVIDALSQGVNVRVIASSATARFRAGPIPDLDAMARQLGVRYILEGNVRRAGANLRVTAQLVEAAGGAILWTQKFERPLTELAALQESLVLDVASHLDAQVSRLEMERVLRKPADLTAWEAVMRAWAAMREMTASSIQAIIEEGGRAVAIAPDYGPGHAIKACGHALLHHYLLAGDAEEMAKARAHVDRALALEANNAVLLGYVAQALNLIGEPAEALRHATRALALSPGMAFGHHAGGSACILLDRADEGIAHFDQEMKASPGAHIHYLSHTWQANGHIRAGRWPEAETDLDRALALNPDFSLALAGKAIICRRGGRAAEARNYFSRTRRAEPVASLLIWELRMRRRFINNPIVEEMVAAVRALWAETEPNP